MLMSESKSLQSEEYKLWISLTRVRKIIIKSRDRFIDRQLIPQTQAAALYYINTSREGVAIEALANYLVLSRNSVSELLGRMKNKGWIKQIKDITENHRLKVILTRKGVEACYQATRPELICEIMSALTVEQREQLRSALEILKEKALKTLSGEIPSPESGKQ
jgi:DNA-binding MarR family transcriptional regulator